MLRCRRTAVAVVLLSALTFALQACCTTGENVGPSSAALEETYWRLTELSGEKVVTPEGGREAHLRLLPEEKQVQGFGGCNGFFGGYELEGDRLSFEPLGSTRMACPDTDDTEMAFFRALESAASFTIIGTTLELKGPDGPVARFEAGSPN